MRPDTFFNQFIMMYQYIMMYILEKKFCETPADFGQISAVAGGLNFGRDRGRGPGRSLVNITI